MILKMYICREKDLSMYSDVLLFIITIANTQYARKANIRTICCMVIEAVGVTFISFPIFAPQNSQNRLSLAISLPQFGHFILSLITKVLEHNGLNIHYIFSMEQSQIRTMPLLNTKQYLLTLM